MAKVDLTNVKEVVRYHSPSTAQVAAHEALARAAENMLVVILNRCPESGDRDEAVRLVRQAKMTASAAVALEGLI